MRLKLKINRTLFKAIERWESRAQDVNKTLSRLRPVLKNDLKKAAAAEKAPSGPWPKRATEKKQHRGFDVKRGRSRKASKLRGPRTAVKFEKRGKLLGSAPAGVKIKTSKHVLRAESTIRNRKGVKIGGVLHGGGKVGRNRKSNIPPRPYVYLSPKFLAKAREKLAEHLVGTWRSA